MWRRGGEGGGEAGGGVMRGRACFQRPSLQGRAIAEIPRIGATPCRPESVRAVRASERASECVWRVARGCAIVNLCAGVPVCGCTGPFRRRNNHPPPLPPNTHILYHPETRTTSSTPPSSPCPSSLLSAPRSHPRARARARARATVAPPDASTRKKSRFGAVGRIHARLHPRTAGWQIDACPPALPRCLPSSRPPPSPLSLPAPTLSGCWDLGGSADPARRRLRLGQHCRRPSGRRQ